MIDQSALLPIDLFCRERSRQIDSCTPNLSGALAVFLCIGSSPYLVRRNSRRYGSTASAIDSAYMPWRRQQSGNIYSAIPDVEAWRCDVGDPIPCSEGLAPRARGLNGRDSIVQVSALASVQPMALHPGRCARQGAVLTRYLGRRNPFLHPPPDRVPHLEKCVSLGTLRFERMARLPNHDQVMRDGQPRQILPEASQVTERIVVSLHE